jgi:hypothetical protein
MNNAQWHSTVTALQPRYRRFYQGLIWGVLYGLLFGAVAAVTVMHTILE